MRRILVAVNEFTDVHMQNIIKASQGWAEVERIDQFSSESDWKKILLETDVCIGWPKPCLIQDSSLQYLQLGSVGYDEFIGIGLDKKSNFQLCNATGVMSTAVAEHFLALMFALTRRLPQHFRDKSKRHWERASSYEEVEGATICVVGVGNIGTEIIKRCQALGMEVIGVRENINRKHPLIKQMFPVTEIQDAIKLANHVVLILPETKKSHHLFNEKAFRTMKENAYLYNLGRGGLIEENALLDALKNNRIAGAGLDVFKDEPLSQDSKFWELNNVIITPHSAGRSHKEFDRLCTLFIENLKKFKNQQPLKNLIIYNS